MYTYQCNFLDIKNERQLAIELMKGMDADDIFMRFIQKRKKENWSLTEIFNKSLLVVVNKTTHEKFRINQFGELDCVGNIPFPG